MTASIIDGKVISAKVLESLAEDIAALKAKGIIPGMAALLIGDNPASEVYVRNKQRAAVQIGVDAQTIHLPATASEADAISNVERLNQDPKIHGFIVQLPLPKHMDENRVSHTMSPNKDIDGFHPTNLGHLVLGDAVFQPCTPSGVIQMLVASGHNPDGRHVVICGRSNIVGRPLAIMLTQKRKNANATVTVCHTGTVDMARYTRQADILIAAMGSPKAITVDMVKEGVVVIDVGTTRVADPTTKSGARFVGDVDFVSVKEKAAAISPVPGGVGPMTIAMLMRNTVRAAKIAAGLPPGD